MSLQSLTTHDYCLFTFPSDMIFLFLNALGPSCPCHSGYSIFKDPCSMGQHMYFGWFQPHQTAGHSCASMRCSTTPTTRAYFSGVGVELLSVLQGDLLTLTCGAATCRCSRAHLPGYGCFFLWRPFDFRSARRSRSPRLDSLPRLV